LLTTLADSGWIPDSLVRWDVRRILEMRLRELAAGGPGAKLAFVELCRKEPVALVPHVANAQHDELPPAFFEAVLGPRLAYSCALWDDGATTLADAEERMLAETAARAGIEDGMAILDLGCGWGPFALWAAEHFPRSRVVAVSNSPVQRRFVYDRAQSRGLYHLTVTAADANRWEAEGRFDRVVSVELFEHIRHHERLLARIARWLAPDGRLFVQHFCHRDHAYPYAHDWMRRHFWPGGMMPSADWLLHFDDDLVAVRRWPIGGTHYARTAEAWLARLDGARERLLGILTLTDDGDDAARWLRRWRIFFLACAEIFAYRGGAEWGVAQVLLAPRVPRS
jgi:cyclopropane-fatty-acyl-phospholipid synthase